MSRRLRPSTRAAGNGRPAVPCPLHGRNGRAAALIPDKVPAPHDWDAWCRWLAERQEPLALARVFPSAGRAVPLLWATGEGSVAAGTERLVRSLQSLRFQRPAAGAATWRSLEQWLAAADGAEPALGFALECLAWCHALVDLPALAAECGLATRKRDLRAVGLLEKRSALSSVSAAFGPAGWGELLEQLTRIASDAAALSSAEHPLERQLLAGELPLTLAYLFPELPTCRALWGPAGVQISAGVAECLGGEGLPPADQWAVAPQLLASWTRCRRMEQAAGRASLDCEAQRQYGRFVRRIFQLARDDGLLPFHAAPLRGWPRPVLSTAVDLADDSAARILAVRVLRTKGKPGPVSVEKVSGLSLHSEESEAAILRRHAERGSAQLVVTYARRAVQCELSLGSLVGWSGAWDLSLRLDGRPLPVASDWEEVCWVSDDDGDYFELQADIAGGGRVQRQLFLARPDNFLLLADAYLGAQSGEIHYRSTLPLSPGCSFVPEPKTQEGHLHARRRWARVLPLALPEWRSGPNRGSLTARGGVLQLEQTARGRNLFAPWFFDLEPRRFAQPLTWRQLTVAERLRIQDPDVAVGQRVQIGGCHWLVYRSLGARGNRTVLGQNYSSEFVLARVFRTREAEKLIEIE